ncbi:glycerol-3-phosphate responsive antiterminator [Irregularibacter muris]|uniref:Glycerol-3-phosphate responsive antiterminator n=1 Tax=Irregularibacter muris TaxID=1796619 RepID=A0AAE3HDV4_9FIRM|nr:glycerol-3-phosphate responsive antiterminator [Irregularibacter muris]MCR1897564.1 glycerol-3-phosphate responsive antiterminator [Irregularibacter muris]
MKFINQKVLPAITNMRDYEKFLQTSFPYCIIMDFHIAQLRPIASLAEKHNKNLIIHVDLIHGLNSDEYAAEYLCQELKLEGLISTRTSVIHIAKKKKKIAIQRIFLIDHQSLDKSYRLLEKSQPDYIEVLPGLIPRMITEVREKTNIPIITGGLITTPKDIDRALQAGAKGVTTSYRELWKLNNEL